MAEEVGCRIAYQRDTEGDLFTPSAADWWSEWCDLLPAEGLVSLTDDDIDVSFAALVDLSERPADRRRRIAATVSGKLLFAIRPDPVTARDHAIASRPGVSHDFAAHLRDARAMAQRWVAQAPGESIRDMVGRPNSSIAKIVDETLYLRITRGA